MDSHTTPYTVVRILYMERVARHNPQALTRSICRGSTAEVAQSLGLSASGNVPALLYPTHLFVLTSFCVLYDMVSHP